MDEKKFIDVDLVISECGIFSDIERNVVIKNIKNLETRYEKYELIQIYNQILVSSKEPDILMTTITCADAYKDESTLGPLVDLLLTKNQADKSTDSDSLINLRVLCAKAISNYKDTSVVGSLLYCLNNKDEHYKVRLACADALGKIGDKFAVTPLINLVQDDEEKSVYLKESAASALGAIGDERAVDPLVSILEAKQGFLDKFSFLKERVIEALGKLNLDNQKVLRALKKSLMDSSPMVRINAIEAIMNSNAENAPELIKSCLKDDNEEVQRNALIAMYNLEGRDILEEVLSSEIYSEYLKEEARYLIEEYEDDDYE
ncbi:MAG: HEAT repeat domain-containing protein [Candidatus Gastranaerophilaceae bacterium]